ncbi:MAG TPA: hypothetical protein VGO04_24430 [Ensifer sp.]|jgi:hypothetical protein|uniref:hypothetical protein n=1 Tax=Ensifer sp. TaxID=1872086 RepID=UPI002E11D5DF|nr:hypothetical protein [Ensifer sp.]
MGQGRRRRSSRSIPFVLTDDPSVVDDESGHFAMDGGDVDVMPENPYLNPALGLAG